LPVRNLAARLGGAAAFLWLGCWITPASAALSDFTLPPPSFAVGDAELTLSAWAGGALFAPSERSSAAASGALLISPQLRRDYDSGLVLALSGTIAASDALSHSRYGGRALEKLFGEMRTGLGRVEIGLTDGAGYQLAVTGPKADPAISLDDPRTSFFRDPATGRTLADRFALRTPVGASSDYAKIVYVSPALFGAQLSLSFTPSEGRQLPFLDAGPDVPGRQTDIWELGLRYSREVGPVSLTAYGAAAEGRGEHKLPGQEGISDLGAGLRADYPLNDDVMLSLGGAYRQSNAYSFAINQSWQGGTTSVSHISGGVSSGDFTVSLEYGSGRADAVAALPRRGLGAWEAAMAYRISPGLSASWGWQHMIYAGSRAPRLSLDAVFFHLTAQTSQ
jgi:hypothetical protein